jgi:hypothetical protein
MTITASSQQQQRLHSYRAPHTLTGLTFRFATGHFAHRKNTFSIPTGRVLQAPHWQLRDLVQCTPFRPQSVFYINNQVLRELDLQTGKISRAMSSWEFTPRCLGILEDYVLVGSEGGYIQGASLNKTKDESMKAQPGTQINNNICLYSALDGTRRALIGYPTPIHPASNRVVQK